MNAPAAPKTLAQATSIMRYYHGLRIHLPYYVGGYFWWYLAEDCVPIRDKPLWTVLTTSLHAERKSLAKCPALGLPTQGAPPFRRPVCRMRRGHTLAPTGRLSPTGFAIPYLHELRWHPQGRPERTLQRTESYVRP